jgi:cell pole-organizing protein PopZ
MSAAEPKPAPGEPPSGQDGSMEDILASIRRILAEDQAAPMPPPSPAAASAPPEEVLDLTEQMLAPGQPGAQPAAPEAAPASQADIDALFAAPPPPAPARPMSDAEIDAMFAAPPASTPAPTPAPASASAAPAPSAGGDLLGGAVAAAAASSFAALRAARGQADVPRQAMPDVALGNGAITLEQVVREELRPLLKAWLDANLPALVERLVKAELERVARG